MSDSKFRSEYLNIKAPDELYDRIMNADETKVKNGNIVQFRKIGSLAAAIAVILVAGFFFMNADKTPEVYVGNEKLTEEVHITEANSGSLMLARMNNEIMCELTINLKTETEVFTSQGSLYSENGEILADNNKSGVFSGELKCKWVVPMPDASFNYIITLKDKSGFHYVKLYYDDEASQWATCFSDTLK